MLKIYLYGYLNASSRRVGSDRHQLKRTSEQAREALGSQELTALADRGHYTGERIKAGDGARAARHGGINQGWLF